MDFSPIQYITDFFGQIGLSKIAGSASILKFLLALLVLFFILTEPAKVIVRKNIGLKALNIYGIILGAAFCFTCGFIVIVLSMICFAIPVVILTKNREFLQSAPASNSDIIIIITCCAIGLYIAWIIKFWFRFGKKVLLLGMEEHFRAKALNSQDWRVREYRGDSITAEGFSKEGYSKDEIWQLADPVMFYITVKKSAKSHPLVVLPLWLITGAFLLNEWYHCFYKGHRLKESVLDMKAENEKINILYNEDTVSITENYVEAT